MVYSGSSHSNFIFKIPRIHKENIVPIRPFAVKEMGLLIGTHKLEDNQIVMKDHTLVGDEGSDSVSS